MFSMTTSFSGRDGWVDYNPQLEKCALPMIDMQSNGGLAQ